MEFDFIKRALEIAVRRGVHVIAIEQQGIKLRIERYSTEHALTDVAFEAAKIPATDAKTSPATPASSHLHAVKAPMTGVIHLSSKPGEPVFVSVGDNVTKGQQIAIIEAMKTFSPIKAPINGIIRDIIVSNGDEVDGGIDIMMIQPVEVV